MEEKFDIKVMKLEQEIFDIGKNINKFKSKNHIKMLNMMEKIKKFSNELKSKNEILNTYNQKNYLNKNKLLVKNYQSFSNIDISPTSPNNRIYQFENNKIPIILKEKEIFNNLNEEKRPIYFYSNKKNKYLSNMSYNLVLENNKNLDIYNNNAGRNICKEEMNKCFSFNYNDLNNINKENDGDIEQRTNSSNNIKIKNIYKNKNFSNDCLYNDLKYSKKKKKNYSKIKNEHKKDMKNVKSYNFKDIPKKLVKSTNNLANHQNNSSRKIKNIKREQCNINISEYYKNINNKHNFTKNNNSRIKITNHKKLKKYPSITNNITQSDNKNISNGNNNSNSSRNFFNNKIYEQTLSSRTKNNKSNSDFSNNCICSTFNPYDNNINYYENLCDNKPFKNNKTVNTLREKISINKNLLLINSNNNRIKNFNQNTNEIENNSDYSYSYFTSRNKKNYSYNINKGFDINKGKKNNTNNYSKDFNDIITNKNNDYNNYDYLSIYNNNINQKKQYNKNQSENNKYINIDEEKYNKLLLILKSNNIDNAIIKIDDLLKYEEFINKIKYLYDKNNNSYFKKCKGTNMKDIFSWIELNIKQNKIYKDELKKYKTFCGKLTKEFNVDCFDKFKNDIMKAVNRNKKEQNLVYSKNNNNLNNGNKNITNSNKENISINSEFYNNKGNISFKNKTSSYSNHSATNFINGDEITITNI